MENIEKFDQLCGELFAEMYACFPDFLDLKQVFPELAQAEPRSEKLAFFINTLGWLENNGLIEVRGSTLYSGAGLVRPTMKGMAMLKMTPASLDPKKSVGDILLDAIRTGSKSALGSIIHDHFINLYASLSTMK